MSIMPPDCWTESTSVFFTSFWGWEPARWGTVGFTGSRGLTRRTNLLKQLTNPFICVAYVTSNRTETDPSIKGMMAGFMLVSHETGDRDAFTHPTQHSNEPGKWRHSLRALRAFNYLPEYRISAREFDPSIMRTARSVSAMGEILTDPQKIEQLRSLPCEETAIYLGLDQLRQAVPAEENQPAMVRAGPASDEGYVVEAGTRHIPRLLYILRLDGDTSAWLGRNAEGQAIYKIGLSASPDLRRQTLQKAMPSGVFKWSVFRTSLDVGACSFEAAVAGEFEMKKTLASMGEWRNGEFYLASNDVIETAWENGLAAIRTVTRHNDHV